MLKRRNFSKFLSSTFSEIPNTVIVIKKKLKCYKKNSKQTLTSQIQEQQSIQVLCKKIENWWKKSENKRNSVPDRENDFESQVEEELLQK
jgi:hypothetical protein